MLRPISVGDFVPNKSPETAFTLGFGGRLETFTQILYGEFDDVIESQSEEVVGKLGSICRPRGSPIAWMPLETNERCGDVPADDNDTSDPPMRFQHRGVVVRPRRIGNFNRDETGPHRVVESNPMDFGRLQRPLRVDNSENVRFRFFCVALLIALAVWQAPQSSSAAGASTTIAPGAPCGATSSPPQYDHVVWILLENVGYSVVDSPSAPYLNSLARECGLAVNYLAITHPSLPNYIALTSGSTRGVTDDNEPSAHALTGPSIFSQLGNNWRALVQSMPSACDLHTSGSYATRHNPAVYYTSLAATCRRNDTPLTFPLNLNARFTFITPNVCDDMHSCPVATGDRWLARIVPMIVESKEYQSRSTVLFITFDENEGGATNQVPTYVIAPSVPRGERVSNPLTHYSLLRTTESLLHLPPLGAARSATSMSKPFHL